ncbi:MAG TPA: type VI secretion system lipoprotein TssJ, partial [Chromatiaceae bacterium]|nr:type VI secretion system lipoprotein TssJ [Chromatiaceae bacterium]
IAAALASLAACGGKPPKEEKPPPVLRVDVTAAPNANRGPGGQALPIVVRLYELRAQGAFSGADFFSLYDREAKTLGGELIAREELTLTPGQTRQIVKPLSPQARYLGVLGAFRDLDHAAWRALVPLADGKDNNLDVAVGAKAIRAQAR